MHNAPSTSGVTPKKTEFKSVFHGLKRKYPWDRNFSCTNCDVTCRSQGELNQHFLDTHGAFVCSICDKKCKTISTMHMHKYEHGDRSNFKKCDDCEKSFLFESQLKTHRKIHLTALEHQCTKCSKWFKNKGEVDKHQAVHSRKVWKCQKCTYECNDPQNLRAHQFKHGDNTHYTCKKCSKGFNYYMQYKRHVNRQKCT